ncbi:hypothetical protein SAMN04487910_0276 [Aquimarina amphilecti]|uniref:DUF1330 domain-containing protein n=1 Tax=Aquimarina amphilecti TaxID=1038014 RepID=A0A1H7G554_AQUAM|nr:hypothetical protein [Aquimarina amphilecti]SEK33258.1 hypothetical protein SAMN04487910_0276 [Aquimarina amphilecti]
MKTYTGINQKQFQDFLELSVDGAFQMINLLKFKKKVEGTELTGAQVYAEYLNAILPFFQDTRAKIIYQGKPLFGLIGPEDTIEWDKILIVEYESKEEFIGMITKKGYPAEMRSRALSDSRLILSIEK